MFSVTYIHNAGVVYLHKIVLKFILVTFQNSPATSTSSLTSTDDLSPPSQSSASTAAGALKVHKYNHTLELLIDLSI